MYCDVLLFFFQLTKKGELGSAKTVIEQSDVKMKHTEDQLGETSKEVQSSFICFFIHSFFHSFIHSFILFSIYNCYNSNT
jgi:hypothetical protein